MSCGQECFLLRQSVFLPLLKYVLNKSLLVITLVAMSQITLLKCLFPRLLILFSRPADATVGMENAALVADNASLSAGIEIVLLCLEVF
jgi:hypothetical protein